MTAPRKTPRSDFNKTMTRELFRALDSSDHENLTALVDAGADLSARNADGLTPLQLAADNRSDDAVKTLIQLGADINAVSTKEKMTALHYAAKNSDTDTLKVLIRARADLNIKDVKGLTPLHHAAIEGDDDNVDLLIAAGADVLAKDNLGRTAAKHAGKKASDENHYMAERYHKISLTLSLKEIAVQKELDRIAAEDAARKAVQKDFDKLNEGFDPDSFKLKPPRKK
ncbi:MAG: ankyrin repeat domain-containing protein [Alphaproteobacteria bacterium]